MVLQSINWFISQNDVRKTFQLKQIAEIITKHGKKCSWETIFSYACVNSPMLVLHLENKQYSCHSNASPLNCPCSPTKPKHKQKRKRSMLSAYKNNNVAMKKIHFMSARAIRWSVQCYLWIEIFNQVLHFMYTVPFIEEWVWLLGGHGNLGYHEVKMKHFQGSVDTIIPSTSWWKFHNHPCLKKKHKKEQEKGTTKVKFYLYIRTIMKLQISVRKYRPKNLKTYPVNCLGTLGYMGSNLSKFISLRFDSYQVLTKFVICIQEKNKLN